MSKYVSLSKGAYSFEGEMPLGQAIPLGLQHVLAMFVGNLTPLLIIGGACGIMGGTDFVNLQISLLQNAMIIAGIVTLIQLYGIGPCGGKVPIIMGSKNKARLAREALLAEGYSEAELARITTPIGIDIGSETPAEIAVSIAAQLIQIRSNKL